MLLRKVAVLFRNIRSPTLTHLFIRVWHRSQTLDPADSYERNTLMDQPQHREFAGVVRFDAIRSILPPHQRQLESHGYLNVEVKGDSRWLMILTADLHLIRPDLIPTFPVTQAV